MQAWLIKFLITSIMEALIGAAKQRAANTQSRIDDDFVVKIEENKVVLGDLIVDEIKKKRRKKR